MNDKILNILNSICEGWTKEYRFDTIKRYRFDYGNLKLKIAVEIEGGIWSGGGHIRGKGYIKDMQKYNLAQLKGWLIFRYTYGQEDSISSDIIKAVNLRKNKEKDKEKNLGIISGCEIDR